MEQKHQKVLTLTSGEVITRHRLVVDICEVINVQRFVLALLIGENKVRIFTVTIQVRDFHFKMIVKGATPFPISEPKQKAKGMLTKINNE